MGRVTRMLILFGLLFAVSPLFALPEPTVEEQEQNRKQLTAWRQNPERMARLRRSARAFKALPEERRQQVLQLDHDFHAKKPAVQARLGAVMERYADWLGKLSDEDRKRVEDEPDKAKRLAIIRELRDREFMRGQPAALREKYLALEGRVRADFVKARRDDESRRKLEWQVTQRFWQEIELKKPLDSRLSDLPKEVQTYVHDYLKMLLTTEEWNRLLESQGQWPGFMITLIDLADRHPPALPGSVGPKTVSSLPESVLKVLRPAKLPGVKLNIAEGSWPEFGIQLARLAKGGKKEKQPRPLPYEFLAYDYNCLSKPMMEFEDKLIKELTQEEFQLYLKAKGKWPDYPQTIQDLARAHYLHPPWFTLPGRGWDAYRPAKPSPSRAPS